MTIVATVGGIYTPFVFGRMISGCFDIAPGKDDSSLVCYSVSSGLNHLWKEEIDPDDSGFLSEGPITTTQVCCSYDATVIIAYGNLFAYSINSGGSFSLCSYGDMPTNSVVKLECNETGEVVYCISSDGNIYKSTSYGGGFSSTGFDQKDPYEYLGIRCSADGNSVVAWTASNLYLSKDGGDSFTDIFPSQISTEIRGAAISPNGSFVVTGGYPGNIYTTRV
jgi:hypothetical protein